MAYATNTQLQAVQPSIVNHGITDFTAQLTEAEADVKRYIEVNWFNKTYSQGFNGIGRKIGATFDASKLVDAQWQRATVYRARYAHILPLLSPFAVGGDTFREMIEHYRNRFVEEMDMEMAQGVQYDGDSDGNITESETFKQRQERIYR
jgi:hypothetical protein